MGLDAPADVDDTMLEVLADVLRIERQGGRHNELEFQDHLTKNLYEILDNVGLAMKLPHRLEPDRSRCPSSARH